MKTITIPVIGLEKYGDVDFEKYMQNPVVFDHTHSGIPIGKTMCVRNAYEEADTEIDVEFDYEIPPTKFDVEWGGIIKECHIETKKRWYKPWTWDTQPIRIIDKFDLMEISLISKPRGQQ